MKKIYAKPATQAVNVELATIIAASPEGYEKTLNKTGTSGSNALGRRNSAWDDEDADD